MDTIINQKGTDVICIYVAIGQKRSTVAQVAETLAKNGAMDYTMHRRRDRIRVRAAAVHRTVRGLRRSANTSCTRARTFSIIYDDLSKHAVAYRAHFPAAPPSART